MLDWRPGCLCAAYCPTERGLQILEELDHTLARSKCMVLLIIAGVVTLITLIASATTSSLALAKEVQTSSYVNHLAENVTNALCI
jgi:hypothetical protein